LEPPLQLRYQPAIQGLRAIAVLLVLAAHAGVPNLYGGLVGVDVFFVISGYLITGLLVTEITSTGKLNLLQFYARRLKRLLPALLLMLCGTAFAIAAFIPLPEHPAQASAAASAALWISNIHFILTEQSYFESTTLANAYLHTWSLGVEEQFYLLWPLLILLIYKANDNLRLPLLVCIALASFTWCLWLTHESPTLAFYLMPARIWQFSIGAIVWLVASQSPYRALPTGRLLLLTGLMAIVGAACWIDKSTRYPDWISLLPTLGAASCLLALDQQASEKAPASVLGWGPLKYIGDISYSLYLWHWPVLVVGQHLLLETTLYSQLLLLATSFILAHLSYRLVENPIRRHDSTRFPAKWQLLACAVAVVLSNVELIKWHNSATREIKAQPPSPYALARKDLPETYQLGCDEWYFSAQVKPCEFGDNTAPRLAVLWGDSIGAQWLPALKRALDLDAGEWRITVLTKAACPIVDQPLFYERLGRLYTECSDWRASASEYIQLLNPELLIIGSSGSYALDSAQWAQGMQRILNEHVSTAQHKVLIAPTFSLGFNGITCLEQHDPATSSQPNATACTTAAENQSRAGAITGLSRAAQMTPATTLIDLNNEVCPDGLCRARMRGVFVYRDNEHLTATFAASLQANLREKLQQAISATPNNETVRGPLNRSQNEE